MSRGKAVFFLVISAFLWGTSFPLIKVAMEKVSPVELFFLRFLFTGLAVLPLLRRSFFSKELALLGLFNSSAFLIQFVGQKYTTATEATLITLGILPLVALLSFFIGEDLDFRKALASFLTLSGAFVITTRLNISHLKFSSIKGNLLIFLATFLWAIFTVISRKIQREGGTEGTTWAILFWTGVFSLPSLAFGELNWSLYAVLIALILAALPTLLAFYLFLEAMKVVDATTSEIIITLQLLFSMIPSVILLGERITLSVGLGTVLILSSIFLVAKESPREN